jgi:TolB protein
MALLGRPAKNALNQRYLYRIVRASNFRKTSEVNTNMQKIILAAIAIVALTISATAEARIYIPVDQPSDQLFPIAVPNLKGGSKGKELAKIIRNDMKLSGYVKLLPRELFKDVAKNDGISVETVRFAFWSAIDAQAVVKGDVRSEGGKLIVTLRLFDPFLRTMLVGKQYTSEKKHLRKVAHRFSDEILKALTGLPGVFNTKIAYSMVTGKGRKEIYVMDMDGHNPFPITKNKSINLSPCWSPDGSKLAFTSYRSRFPDLYIANVGKKGMTKITNDKGANITPSWSPNGKLIAFASTVSGAANLYTIPKNGRNMKRVTTSYNIDIAPSWSPDGNHIVFASERAGGLHLFRINASGGDMRRLTFVGYQNDMPNWSPMGDKIVFSGRDMGTFDIFIMNPDGSNIQRLTVGSGANSHPTFSPDGRFISFTSTRGGGEAIYIMRADGTNQIRVSKKNGLLPSWGPRIK